MDRLAVGPDSSTENVKLYKGGDITMSGLLRRSGCPTGFVMRGQGLCVEDDDTCYFSLSGAANRCRTAFPSFGAHQCTNVEIRMAMSQTTTIGATWYDDYIAENEDDNDCPFVNDANNANDPDGEDQDCNPANHCSRCCIDIE
ncbi:MAG: hypothetical protein HYY13_12165 [Nitrospirae bacterium]|nr:hypothetical protein [Nitrospirota bacterium]